MKNKRTGNVGALDPLVSKKILETLNKDHDILVPIKKLYKHFLKDEILPPYEMFLAEIKSCPILAVVDLEDKTEDEDWDEPEMEALGYYTGPRVRLKDRVPSPADIAAILKRHTDRIMESLGQAYCLGAEGFTEEEEDGMLTLLERAKNLRDSVQKAIPVPKKKAGKSGKRAKGRKESAS